MSSLFQICNSLSFMLSWFEKKIPPKMGFLEFNKMCLMCFEWLIKLTLVQPNKQRPLVLNI